VDIAKIMKPLDGVVKKYKLKVVQPEEYELLFVGEGFALRFITSRDGVGVFYVWRSFIMDLVECDI
jgi:hypothetical protein